MHVLTLDEQHIFSAERWQRLCMEMADYTPEEQARMHITSVSALD